MKKIVFLIMITLLLQLQSDSTKPSHQELIQSLNATQNGLHQLSLAIIYLNGIKEKDSLGENIEADVEKSLLAFNKAIELKYFEAANILGLLYIYHPSLRKREEAKSRSKELLLLAQKHGLTNGLTELANKYFDEQNFKEGMRLLFLGSHSHLSSSQLMLAIIYRGGLQKSCGAFIVPPNTFLANKYINLACTNKNKTSRVKKYCREMTEEIKR